MIDVGTAFLTGVPGRPAVLAEVEAFVAAYVAEWRKPHPRIYATALDTLGLSAGAAVFAGDTYEPDFAGPERAGITAFLIDPYRQAPVPEDRRLNSILDLPASPSSSTRTPVVWTNDAPGRNDSATDGALVVGQRQVGDVLGESATAHVAMLAIVR